MPDLIAFVGSARRGGNTDTLVSEALSGARKRGATARRIRLADLDMRPCRGCMRCFSGRCKSHRDDMDLILGAMLDARALLFATPVYFWNVSGLMKTLWDRMLPLAGLDIRTRPLAMKPLLRGVRAGVLVVQEEPEGPHGSIPRMFFDRNFLDFGMEKVGEVFAYGALRRGEIKKDRTALASARALGRKLVAP
ncbi:MAG: flavodoxin family protein [Deltaproteobacteria bacterium]|nr:flavodoxin family protein [Deltaproteobacteria bacterium]